MAISVVGTTTSGSQASGTTLATSFPTGWAANDVAFIFIDQVSGTTAPTTPAGWTLVASQTGANPRMWCYRRVLVGGDTAPSITVTSVARDWSCVILHGVDTTTPEDGTNNHSTALTQAFEDAQSVTTSVANDYLLTAYSNTAGKSGTPPAGATEQADTNSTTAIAMQTNTEALGAAGATGTRRETLSGNGANEASLTVAARAGANLLTRSASDTAAATDSASATVTPAFVSGSASDSGRNFDSGYQDFVLIFSQSVTDSSFSVGATMNGFLIHYDGVAKTPTYRSGNGTTTFTVRVSTVPNKTTSFDFSYSQAAGNLLNGSSVEVAGVTNAFVANNLTLHIHESIKNYGGSLVTSTACKVAVLLYNSAVTNADWMKKDYSAVVSTDSSGMLDFGFSSLNVQVGDTVYLAVLWPDSGPTESLLWTFVVL